MVLLSRLIAWQILGHLDFQRPIRASPARLHSRVPFTLQRLGSVAEVTGAHTGMLTATDRS